MICSHLEWSARKVTTCSFVELTSLRTLFVIVRIRRLEVRSPAPFVLPDVVGVEA